MQYTVNYSRRTWLSWFSWMSHVDCIYNTANHLFFLNATPRSKELQTVVIPICWVLLSYLRPILTSWHQKTWNSSTLQLNKPWQRKCLDLEDWPKLAQLIILFKILRNTLVVPDHCLPALTPMNSIRAYHIRHNRCLQNSFLLRTINTWNNLDVYNLDKINLDTFKNNLTLLL